MIATLIKINNFLSKRILPYILIGGTIFYLKSILDSVYEVDDEYRRVSMEMMSMQMKMIEVNNFVLSQDEAKALMAQYKALGGKGKLFYTNKQGPAIRVIDKNNQTQYYSLIEFRIKKIMPILESKLPNQ